MEKEKEGKESEAREPGRIFWFRLFPSNGRSFLAADEWGPRVRKPRVFREWDLEPGGGGEGKKKKKKDSRFSFVLSLTRSARSVTSVPLSIDEDTRASASPPIVVVLVVAVAAP